MASTSLEKLYYLASAQGAGSLTQGPLSQLWGQVVVGSGMAIRIVIGSDRSADIAGKKVEGPQSFRAEIVAQKVTPPSSTGLKEVVDSNGDRQLLAHRLRRPR